MDASRQLMLLNEKKVINGVALDTLYKKLSLKFVSDRLKDHDIREGRVCLEIKNDYRYIL